LLLLADRAFTKMVEDPLVELVASEVLAIRRRACEFETG
jgi:hypothetical protein